MHQKEALLEESMVGANGASSRGADTYKSLDLDYHFVLPSPLLAVIAVMPPQQRGPSRHGTAEKSGKCWYLGEETE